LSHIALAQQVMIDIWPQADAAAQAFYQRLFEMDPSLRSLFTHEPAEQRRKFMDMLATLIAGLDRLHILLPEIHELGRRHADYGVKPEHYAVAGVALLGAVEQTLGHQLADDARSAWIQAYELLTNAMRVGGLTLSPTSGETPLEPDSLAAEARPKNA